MKLCVVTPFPPRFLALGNYAWALLPEIAAQPEVQETVVLADTGAAAWAGTSLGTGSASGSVRVVPCWDPEAPRVLSQIAAAIRSERPDLVWFNTGFIIGRRPLPNLARLAAPALCARWGIPSVVTLHHLLEAEPLGKLDLPKWPLQRQAGRFATKLLFKADRVCLTLRRYVDLARRAYSAANLVHVPHHVFAPPRHAPVSSPPVRLLTFGTLAPYKGIDVLLEAHAVLSGRISSLELRLAGGAHPRFPGLAERLGLATRPGLAWLGEQPEEAIDGLMAWADVVVVPSLASTGSSSVIHRAAARGKVIVASDLPDFRALVDEEGMAIELVPPGDAAALATAIERIHHDAGLVRGASAANLAAAARLTPGQVASRYVAVFRAALESAPAHAAHRLDSSWSSFPPSSEACARELLAGDAAC
ncbi:MAG: glycosyltransferase [Chloroflexota bacterium]